jgi:aminopeptidase C
MLGLSSKFLPKHVGIFDSSQGRFVYQVVVPKALAPRDLVQVYEAGDMVVLPPWDPLVCFYAILSFVS